MAELITRPRTTIADLEPVAEVEGEDATPETFSGLETLATLRVLASAGTSTPPGASDEDQT